MILLALGLGLVAVACGAGGAAETTAAAETSSTEASTTLASDVWDLLYIQDSHGWGVADLYADRIEADEGVSVTLHDKAIGNLSAVSVLANLTGEGNEDWSQLVEKAEVIVFFGNPIGSGSTEDFASKCMLSPTEGDPPVRYSDSDLLPYRQVLDQVYKEIWRLRSGEAVVLRAVGLLDPAPHLTRDAGIGTECTAALEAINTTLEQAAVAAGATFVPTYDLFNGPNHDQNPNDRGWIGPDGTHLSVEGQIAFANGLAALGYGSNTAP